MSKNEEDILSFLAADLKKDPGVQQAMAEEKEARFKQLLAEETAKALANRLGPNQD